ncbi:ficolin-2-like isoform X2 [Rhopilema esculentum]|uniref:ficolin-2-like isoform X2 n=1 Tax=Rhopilema esculentum TaxID=499914 RepID=UPI0031DF64B3
MLIEIFSRLIIKFSCQNVQGHILRLPCVTFAQFSRIMENFQLYGEVIETFEDLHPNECKYKCIHNLSCRSLSTTTSSGVNCKIHNKSAEDPYDFSMMSPSTGWTYWSTNYRENNVGQLCQSIKPCDGIMTCKDSCMCPGFQCYPGLEEIYSSCQDAYSKGKRDNRAYPLYLHGLGAYRARCDMATLSRGWIVFQRRASNSVDFYRGWEEYKKGFGDPQGNYWLGLERLHHLARPGKGAILRVELQHQDYPGVTYYASYSTFEIENEENQYRINVSGYSGNAGNSLVHHDGMKFSTKDRDNDLHSINCAQRYHGAWWYKYCHDSNLNGVYLSNGISAVDMGWYSLKNHHGKIKFSEMKIGYQ